jgi:hypothetical protein
VTLAASAVAVGDCATVIGSTSKGKVTARSVTISQPSSGTCTPGAFRNGRAGTGSGAGGFAPGGGGLRSPGASPGNGARRFAGLANSGFASGRVTSVSPRALVLTGVASSGLTGAGAKAKSTSPGKKAQQPALRTTTVHVKLASSTTYSETQPAAASNLSLGDCVTATGSSDSTGAVAAATVRITSTGAQTCTTGIGGAGGAGGAGGFGRLGGSARGTGG